MTVRRSLTTAAVAGAAVIAAAPAALAHSPTDFLKVPVGHVGTVLLPPMTAPGGRLEVAIAGPAGYRITAASAGPDWTARVTPRMAVLDGQSERGSQVLVTVGGIAARPGTVPLTVRLLSPAAPSQQYQWQLTALAGYAQPRPAGVAADAPDAAVAVPASSHRAPWLLSAVLAALAAGVLVVRRPRRQESTG